MKDDYDFMNFSNNINLPEICFLQSGDKEQFDERGSNFVAGAPAA